MTKWFCRVTCTVKVFLLLFLSLKQFYFTFIIKELFCNVVHISSEVLSFLHGRDYCSKCGLIQMLKQKSIITMMENSQVFSYFHNTFSWDHLWMVAIAKAVSRKCCLKKDVLKNVANFTGKHLCQSLNKRVSLFCKPVLSPGPPFLITYCSTSNLNLCFSFCIIINSFHFTTIDTAIIRSSRPLVFLKKDVLTNFEQFAREHLC